MKKIFKKIQSTISSMVILSLLFGQSGILLLPQSALANVDTGGGLSLVPEPQPPACPVEGAALTSQEEQGLLELLNGRTKVMIENSKTFRSPNLDIPVNVDGVDVAFNVRYGYTETGEAFIKGINDAQVKILDPALEARVRAFVESFNARLKYERLPVEYRQYPGQSNTQRYTIYDENVSVFGERSTNACPKLKALGAGEVPASKVAPKASARANPLGVRPGAGRLPGGPFSVGPRGSEGAGAGLGVGQPEPGAPSAGQTPSAGKAVVPSAPDAQSSEAEELNKKISAKEAEIKAVEAKNQVFINKKEEIEGKFRRFNDLEDKSNLTPAEVEEKAKFIAEREKLFAEYDKIGRDSIGPITDSAKLQAELGRLKDKQADILRSSELASKAAKAGATGVKCSPKDAARLAEIDAELAEIDEVLSKSGRAVVNKTFYPEEYIKFVEIRKGQLLAEKGEVCALSEVEQKYVNQCKNEAPQAIDEYIKKFEKNIESDAETLNEGKKIVSSKKFKTYKPETQAEIKKRVEKLQTKLAREQVKLGDFEALKKNCAAPPKAQPQASRRLPGAGGRPTGGARLTLGEVGEGAVGGEGVNLGVGQPEPGSEPEIILEEEGGVVQPQACDAKSVESVNRKLKEAKANLEKQESDLKLEQKTLADLPKQEVKLKQLVERLKAEYLKLDREIQARKSAGFPVPNEDLILDKALNEFATAQGELDSLSITKNGTQVAVKSREKTIARSKAEIVNLEAQVAKSCPAPKAPAGAKPAEAPQQPKAPTEAPSTPEATRIVSEQVPTGAPEPQAQPIACEQMNQETQALYQDFLDLEKQEIVGREDGRDVADSFDLFDKNSFDRTSIRDLKRAKTDINILFGEEPVAGKTVRPPLLAGDRVGVSVREGEPEVVDVFELDNEGKPVYRVDSQGNPILDSKGNPKKKFLISADAKDPVRAKAIAERFAKIRALYKDNGIKSELPIFGKPSSNIGNFARQNKDFVYESAKPPETLNDLLSDLRPSKVEARVGRNISGLSTVDVYDAKSGRRIDRIVVGSDIEAKGFVKKFTQIRQAFGLEPCARPSVALGVAPVAPAPESMQPSEAPQARAPSNAPEGPTRTAPSVAPTATGATKPNACIGKALDIVNKFKKLPEKVGKLKAGGLIGMMLMIGHGVALGAIAGGDAGALEAFKQNVTLEGLKALLVFGIVTTAAEALLPIEAFAPSILGKPPSLVLPLIIYFTADVIGKKLDADYEKKLTDLRSAEIKQYFDNDPRALDAAYHGVINQLGGGAAVVQARGAKFNLDSPYVHQAISEILVANARFQMGGNVALTLTADDRASLLSRAATLRQQEVAEQRTAWTDQFFNKAKADVNKASPLEAESLAIDAAQFDQLFSDPDPEVQAYLDSELSAFLSDNSAFADMMNTPPPGDAGANYNPKDKLRKILRQKFGILLNGRDPNKLLTKDCPEKKVGALQEFFGAPLTVQQPPAPQGVVPTGAGAPAGGVIKSKPAENGQSALRGSAEVALVSVRVKDKNYTNCHVTIVSLPDGKNLRDLHFDTLKGNLKIPLAPEELKGYQKIHMKVQCNEGVSEKDILVSDLTKHSVPSISAPSRKGVAPHAPLPPTPEVTLPTRVPVPQAVTPTGGGPPEDVIRSQ